jgi:TonB family protein
MLNRDTGFCMACGSDTSSHSRRVYWVLAGFVVVLLVRSAVLYGYYLPQAEVADELDQGIALYRSSQFMSATDHLQKAVRDAPQSAKAWLYLGACYAHQLQDAEPGIDSPKGQQDAIEARESFEHVLKIDPNNKLGLAAIATLVFWMRDFQKAKEYQQKRSNVDPGNPQPGYWIGVLDWVTCFPRDMLLRRQFGIAGSLEPLPENARAQLEKQNGGLVVEGLKALSKALELKPGDADTLIFLNLMYRQKADLERGNGARSNDLRTADRFVQKALAARKLAAAARTTNTPADKDFAIFLTVPPPPPPPGAAIPQRIRVAGEVESAKLIFQPKPEYPPVAKMARIQGVVRLDALIGKDGTIEDLKVISGHPLLVKPAIDSVEKWRFQPTLLNGNAVEVATEIDVNFMLAE